MNTADAAALKYWEWFSDLGNWLVIIGVAAEAFEIVAKCVERRYRKYQGFRHWFHRWELWIDVGMGAALLLLVVGLAMEMHGNHKVNELKNRELAWLTLQLESTTKQAGEAIERAAKADLARVELEKQIVATKSIAESAEKKLKDRRIGAAQREIIVSGVKDVHGEQVVLWYSSADAEAERYANDFAEVLTAVGYSVERQAAVFVVDSGSPASGVLIAVDRVKHPPSTATLQGVLNKAGVPVQWSAGGRENAFFISVGRKL